MRSLDVLQKELQDTILVHGEKCEAAARTKSLIGIHYMEEENYDRALLYFEDVSHLCRALGIHQNELGLDNEYRRGKMLELRATNEASKQEAADILSEVAGLRKKLDAESKRTTIVSADEQFDSTLIYYDEALQVAATADKLRALSLLDTCLAIRKSKFGDFSVPLITVILDYADILTSLDRFIEARDMLNDALEIAVRTFGRTHTRVAEVLNSMGNLHRSMFELDDAEKLLLECYSIRKELLPENDIRIGTSLNNLAEVKRMQRLYVDAIRYHQQALAIFSESVGEEHPAYINAKGNYGVTLQQFAVECEAKGVNYLSEAVDYLHAKAYQADHPWIRKFGMEQVLTSARRLATNHEYDRSIQLYDVLIKKRQDHIAAHSAPSVSGKSTSGARPASSSGGGSRGSPVKFLSPSKADSAPQAEITDVTIVQNIRQGEEAAIHELEVERFQVMVKYLDKLTECNDISRAMDQLEQCEKYVVMPTIFTSRPGSAQTDKLKIAPFPSTPLSSKAKYAASATDGKTASNKGIILPDRSPHEFDLFISLQYTKAKLLRYQALYAEAIGVLDMTVSYIHKRKGQEADDSLQYRLLLAEIHCEMGRYSETGPIVDKVMKQLERAMDKDIKLQGKASLSSVTFLCSALVVSIELRMASHSVDAVQQLLNRLADLIRTNNLGDHVVHVKYLMWTIQMNHIRGSYDYAMNTMETALNIQNNLTGKEHMDYVSLLLELALLYIQRGAHPEAFKTIDEAQKVMGRLMVSPAAPASVQGGESTELGSVMSANDFTLANGTIGNVSGSSGPDHPLFAQLYYVKAKYYQLLHRTAESIDYVHKAVEVIANQFPDQENHPFLVRCYRLLADLNYAKCEYRDCQEAIRKVLAIRKTLRSENHIDHDTLWMEFQQAAILSKKGQVFLALQALDKVLASLGQYKRYYKQPGALLLEGWVWLEYGKALMHSARFVEAKAVLARGGIVFYDYFHTYSNLHVPAALLRIVEMDIFQGKHKDAKVLLSYLYNYLLSILTYRYANHPLMIDTLLLATENMRAVGYFPDAIDTLSLLKGKISVSYSALTMEYVLYRLKSASIYKDRRLPNKAEPIFQELESNLSLLCGESSMYTAMHKIEQAESFLYTEQVPSAEKLLVEAMVVLQAALYQKKMDSAGASSHIQSLLSDYSQEQGSLSNLSLSWLEIRILIDYCHLKVFSSKPAVIQHTMQSMQSMLAPFVQQVLSRACGGNTNHMVWFYVQGLVALLSNKFKFGSGRRLLFDSLRGLDELSPFNLPFDHPYVMALGGYEKASSKNRLSTNIAEGAFFTWATEREEGDELLPKSMMVDVANHDENLWAVVHYFGQTAGQEGAGGSTTEGAAGTRKGRSHKRGSRSRSPSPQERGRGAAGQGGSGGGAGGSGQGKVTHDEAFQAEQRARQAAEDQVVMLKHQNADLIEQLLHEKEENDRLVQALAEVQEKFTDLDGRHAAFQEHARQLEETLQATSKELADLKYQRQLEEEEKARKAAELEARLQADEKERAKAIHRKYSQLLEHARYLLQKGDLCVTQGYYYDSLPIYEEACSVIHSIQSMNHVETLQAYLRKANALIHVEYYESAKDLIQASLQTIDDHGASIADLPDDLRYELQTTLYLVYHKQGVLFSYVCDLDTYIKDYGLKLQNMSSERASESSTAAATAAEGETPAAPTATVAADSPSVPSISAHYVHYARALTLLAHFYIEISRSSEAKALIEKSLTILSKECGAAHVYTLEAQLVKALILFYNNKYKECLALCEQRLMAVKVSLKGHYELYGSVVMTMESIQQAPALNLRVNPTDNMLTIPAATVVNEFLGKSADANSVSSAHIPHPLVVQTFLVMCRALYGMSNFSEMKNKLQFIRPMIYTFFKHTSLVVLDYLFLESELLAGLGHFSLALDKHLAILKEREVTVRHNYLIRHGNYRSLAFHNSLSITNAIAASSATPPAVNIMAHNMFTESLFSIAHLYVKMGKFGKAKDYLTNLIKLNVAKSIIPPSTASSSTAQATTPGAGDKSAPATASSPATSLKGNHILYYYSKCQLLYLQVLAGDYENVTLYLENLKDELSGNSIHKESLCSIYLMLVLSTAYFHVDDLETAEKILNKAQRYLKNAFSTDHILLIDMTLLKIQMQLSREQILAAWEAVQTLHGLVHNLYNVAAEHENFAILKVWEGKVRLDALIHKLELPALVTAEITIVEQESAAAQSGMLVSSTGKPIPWFDNKRFSEVLQVLDEAREKYLQSMALDVHRSMTGPNAAVIFLHNTMINPQRYASGATLQVKSLPCIPPLFVYLEGLIGQIKLLEFTFLQAFVNSLSSEEKEIYYSHQSQAQSHRSGQALAGKRTSMASNKAGGRSSSSSSSQGSPDPPGYNDLKSSIHDLQQICLVKPSHSFVIQLNQTLAGLILQFDPLQIAHFNYNQALLAFNQGEYLLASKLFNLVVHSYFTCFGYLQSTQSYLMAELLHYKAQTSIHLCQSIPFSHNLLLLSSRIYKLHLNSEHENFFLYRNRFYLSQLLMQQKQYDAAYTLQQRILESIEEQYVHNPNIDPSTKMTNIAYSVENVELNLLAIRIKISMAVDHIHMFHYKSAEAMNRAALDLLKKVHAIDLMPLLQDAASSFDDDSLNRVHDVNAVSASNINALLADLLVQIYTNEVMLHDRWGRFKQAEEYLAQIENVLSIWEHIADGTKPSTSSAAGRHHWADEEDEKQVDMIAGAVGAREEVATSPVTADLSAAPGGENPPPTTDDPSSSPVENADQAAEATAQATAAPAQDAEPSNTPQVEGGDGDAGTVTDTVGSRTGGDISVASPNEKRKQAGLDANQTSRSAQKPAIPEYGRFLRLKAEILHLRAEHLTHLSRYNEVAALVEKSLELKHLLYNIHFPANWEKHGIGAHIKRGNKASAGSATAKGSAASSNPASATDYAWSAQKEEEVNMNCMETLQILFSNNYSNKQNIDDKDGHVVDERGGAEAGHEAASEQDASAAGGGGGGSACGSGSIKRKSAKSALEAEKEKDDNMDYLSVITALRRHDHDDSQSVSDLSLLEIFDVKNKKHLSHQVFLLHNQKVLPHFSLLDTILLLSKLYFHQCQLSACKEMLDMAQKFFTLLVPPSHSQESLLGLNIQYGIAQYLALVNQLRESQNLHTTILEKRLSMLPTQSTCHGDILDSYVSICQLHILMNNYDEGMQTINTALSIARNLYSFQEEHPQIQFLLLYCAEIMIGKGFYADATMLIEKCLAHLKSSYSDLHTAIATAYSLLAWIDLELCKFEESINYLNIAKNVYSIVFHPAHHTVGMVYYRLAQNYRGLNKFLESKQQLDLAIQILRSSLGKYHYNTLFILLEMAVNFVDRGRHSVAVHLFERVGYLFKKHLSKDHLMVAHTQFHLGVLYMHTGQLDKVLPAYNQALYIYRKILNTDRHILVSSVLYHIYYLQGLQGAYEAAIQSFDNIIAVMKLIYHTPNHYYIAEATYFLACIFYQQNKIFHAQSYFQKTIDICKHIYSNSSEPSLMYLAYGALGSIDYLLGNYEQAKAVIERSVSHTKDILSPMHPQVAKLLVLQGSIYNVMGKYNQAKDLLVEAYQIQFKALFPCNPHHPDLAECLLALADNCRYRGFYDVVETKKQVPKKKNAGKKGGKGSKKSKKAKKLLKDKSRRGGGLAGDTVEEGDENEDEDEGQEEDEEGDDGETEGEGRGDTSSAMDAKNALQSGAGAGAVSSSLARDRMKESSEESGLLFPSSHALASSSLPEQNSSLRNAGPSRSLSHQPSSTTTTPSQALVPASGFPHEDKAALVLAGDGQEDGQEAKDDDSVPSVMISVIEHLDNDDQRPGGSALSAGDDFSIPEVRPEATSFLDDENAFCAMPLLQRALDIYNAHLQNLPYHHYIFNTKHLIAEVKKMLGRYDEALEMHEEIFHQRRKHLGDQHFDTIHSLVAIADTLRTMKRIYAASKISTHNDKVHKGSALGTDDINHKDLSRIAGTVTLQDHLLALAQPLQGGLGGEALATTKRRKKDEYALDKKVFLTHLDDDDGKGGKHKALPIPKGYMGYAFPSSKANLSRPATAGELLSAFNQAAANRVVSTNPLHDCKKCLESATNLLKKVLNKEDPIHTGNQTLVRKDQVAKFEVDHPLLAMCLFNKSEMYRMRGDYASALKALEACLTMRRKLYRSNHVLVSDCLLSMGLLLYSDQRYVQCIPLFNKALEMRIQGLHSTHPAVAEVYNAMSLLYIKLGDYTVAGEYSQQAMEIVLQRLGTNHPATGNVFMNYAGLLQAQNNYTEALEYYRRALDTKLRVYKDDHPETASVYNNIAMLYRHFQKTDLALEHYEKALDIQKKVLGVNHPDVATTYNNMATLLSAFPSRRFEAKEMFKMSLSIRLDCFGQVHVLVANTMNNYAILLFELNEWKAAKNLFLDAYDIRKKIYNNNNFNSCHPALAESLANLAFWEYNQGSVLEAIALYEQALAMRKQSVGAQSAIVATTCLQLSAAYLKNKNMKSALEYGEMAYTLRLNLLGELHTDTLAAKKADE